VSETTVKNFYAVGFDALVRQHDKCINVGGGYVEKHIFFSRFEYHVLRFISICDLFTDSPSYTKPKEKMFPIQKHEMLQIHFFMVILSNWTENI
jgi:hypothetical protein